MPFNDRFLGNGPVPGTAEVGSRLPAKLPKAVGRPGLEQQEDGTANLRANPKSLRASEAEVPNVGNNKNWPKQVQQFEDGEV